MALIKNIFARFWAVWGLFSFIFTFLLFFIPSMLSHCITNTKKSQDFFIEVAKKWMQVWLFLIACPLKIKGKENFIENENYIITFNHNTFLDVPITCPFIPGGNKTIGKHSFAKVPIFGFFYRKGAILVNRKNDKSRRDSFIAMKDFLSKGLHIGIFPEGTRNRTQEPLKSFYDGAFKLAIETNKKIIPAVLFNTANAMPNNKFLYLYPINLHMHFLAPINPQNKTVTQLKDEVFNIMLNYYITKKADI